VNGQAKFPVVNSETLAVVTVIVRYHEGMNVFDIAAMASESSLCLIPTDSRIEQDLHSVRFDVNAVSVASGIQGDGFHGGIVPKTSMCALPLCQTRIAAPWFLQLA
jgi:hypothetical protein